MEATNAWYSMSFITWGQKNKSKEHAYATFHLSKNHSSQFSALKAQHAEDP